MHDPSLLLFVAGVLAGGAICLLVLAARELIAVARVLRGLLSPRR